MAFHFAKCFLLYMPKKQATFPNRLREWRERRKLTLEAVQEKTGLGITKLHRLEMGSRRLKVDDAEILSTAYGVPAHALMLDGDGLGASPLETVMITQKAHAGVWLERAEIDTADWQVLTIPRAKNPAHKNRYGVVVADDSMDILYPAGSVVIVTPIKGGEVKSGQRVIVRRTRGDGRIELTVREFQSAPDGRLLLWPRSTRMEYQQPFSIGAHGDTTTTIDAIVVGAYRFEE